MGFSLNQISNALDSLCIVDGDKTVSIDKINEAGKYLADALESLNGLTVQGRNTIDSLLGCMMALEQIIGGENNG